ncbi:MAG: ABC transporter permease, partial [Mesorhizobium sp.]|nr:ABC transporter permease [Mesorhizobium sp.]
MLTKADPDASETDATIARIDVRDEDGGIAARLAGPWTTQTVAVADDQMRALDRRSDVHTLSIDLGDVTRMDTAGAWLVKRLITAQEAAGASVTLSGASANMDILLNAVSDATKQEVPLPRAGPGYGPIALLERLGRTVINLRGDLLMSMHILGATIAGAQMKLGRGHAVNPAAIASQIDKMGIGAIPVVLLMSSIIGAIIAQQGAFQLRYFGAEIFVVDLVGILVLREIGVLLTAIMIAGRSGSAITAEIGSMKMREEIDALTVIGLNPVGVLVFPRLVALVIVLPCLTIAANFAAMGGAIAVSYVYSGIAPTTFIDRFRDAIDLTTIFAGLIKA